MDLSAAPLADELHAQLTRLAGGRDLRVLRHQARSDFRAVMRHVRARRLAGKRRAPFDIRRTDPPRPDAVRPHAPPALPVAHRPAGILARRRGRSRPEP